MMLGGCGTRDTTPRYEVSGAVTYAGQPIPTGTILFLPDGTKNNHGPSGFAKIQEGKYNTTLNGKGMVGGPHLVRITGFDGRPREELPNGKRHFPDYTTTTEFPKETTTCDVNIPAEPAQQRLR